MFIAIRCMFKSKQINLQSINLITTKNITIFFTPIKLFEKIVEKSWQKVMIYLSYTWFMKISSTMSSNRIKQNILANAPSMKINTLNTEHANKLLYQIRFFKHPVPRHIIVNVFSLYWLAISLLTLSLWCNVGQIRYICWPYKDDTSSQCNVINRELIRNECWTRES